MAKMIGTVNGYVLSRARYGRKAFVFNGTTLGLVKAALALGAKDGTTIHADFGGGFKPMKIYANPMDDRAGGYWAK